jgi:hypothetical protein
MIQYERKKGKKNVKIWQGKTEKRKMQKEKGSRREGKEGGKRETYTHGKEMEEIKKVEIE